MSGKSRSSQDKLRGGDGFDVYYSRLYGERWSVLRQALLSEKDDVAWRISPEMPPYFLDRGSVRAALSLPLQGASRVLDMCAAPGGKTLVLASMMDRDARLVSNERSRDRMMRLARVADEHMPQDIRRRVDVICGDAARMCLSHTECYDRILLDAPCSSERHVLSAPSYLAQWSPSRIKTLAVAQWSLLSSAYRMLKPGGLLLYATCALSPAENDELVVRLQKKFPDVKYHREVPPIPPDALGFFDGELPEAEATQFGFHVLPDRTGGAGPLYFCLIQKPEDLS